MCTIPPALSRNVSLLPTETAENCNRRRNWIFAKRKHSAWRNAGDQVRSFVRTAFGRSAALVLLIFSGAANGQVSIEPVYGWVDKGSDPTGGLVLGSDGNFYGTTNSGGANGKGTIFRISGTGEHVVLHSFANTFDSAPHSNLVQGRDGNFYGTKREGGANRKGEVFRISPSGEYVILYSFTGSGGHYPTAGLVQGSDGYLYGTTGYGGTGGGGTIFRVSTSGKHEVLHSFDGTIFRQNRGPLVEARDGYLYGTSFNEGVNGKGMIFRISKEGEYAILHSFTGSDGSYPYVGLIQGSDGYLYGTTGSGGTSGVGTVFRICAAGKHEMLHSFSGADGNSPSGALMEGNDGYFYGTTGAGGTNDVGTVFRISAAGNHEVLYSFSGSNGRNPRGKLVRSNDGYFYGATSYGGASDQGTIFRFSTAGTYTVVHAFGRSAGFSPVDALVRGTDGYFYGATSSGGLNEKGTIYRVSMTGEHEVLHSFSGTDGARPDAGLVLGNDGYFYGTTSRGGSAVPTSDGVQTGGTIFRISVAGEHKVLHFFAGPDGYIPSEALVQGSDGFFYGTTLAGGGNGKGTIFRISVEGAFELLHSFSAADGYYPSALVQGADGSFYGTTGAGGAVGYGTIFRISAAGEYAVLRSNTDTDGTHPSALVKGKDGYFYGTTATGGPNGFGTVFRISAAGEYWVLYSFKYANGGYFPNEGLLQGSDNYFYGTTSGGERNDKGGIFRISTEGQYTLLYTFSDADGKYLRSPFVAGSDGNLWGTTSSDTVYGGGIIYRVLFAPETLPADSVKYSSAIVQARVSRGSGTAVYFEYGTDWTMSAVENTELITLSEGANLVMVSATLSELEAGTIYYYRPCIRRADGSVLRGYLYSFITSLDEPQVTVLASKGAAVPGAGNPDSGIPSGATWSRFGLPALGGRSHGAFSAGLKLSTGASLTGIFAGESATPVLLLKKGDAATGLPEGMVFSTFKDPLLNDLGELVFVGSVSGGGKSMQGIWSNAGVRSGKPEWLVALQGTEAAGISSGARWKSFISVALSDSGVISFTATLEPGRGGVTSANDFGLWLAKPSGTALLLREGQDLVLDGVTRKVKRFVALPFGLGRLTADGKLPVRVTFRNNTQALLQFNADAEPEVIAANGDVVSGTGGAIFRSFGVPALNQTGTAVFAATLVRGTADVDRSNDSGVFITQNDNWSVVARKGSVAPGIILKGTLGKFVTFANPLINAEGQVAFVGTTTGGAKGIWWRSGAGDNLQLVASTAATDVPGVDGARFSAFKSVVLPDDSMGGPVFVATVEGKGITSVDDMGLWAVDREGMLRLLVREGDTIDGKVVRGFTFPSATSFSSAQSYNYGTQRQLIYRAFFTDGSQSLLTVLLP